MYVYYTQTWYLYYDNCVYVSMSGVCDDSNSYKTTVGWWTSLFFNKQMMQGQQSKWEIEQNRNTMTNCPLGTDTQITMNIPSTSIRHLSETYASDGCVIDIDLMVFAIWKHAITACLVLYCYNYHCILWSAWNFHITSFQMTVVILEMLQ